MNTCNSLFQSMDLETKLELMKHTDSYWTLLPTEIKEVILNYKERQELIEWRESEVSQALCRQIEMHGRLRAIWPGHIQCRPMRFEGVHVRTENGCSFGPYCDHMRIYGYYYGLEDDSTLVRRKHFIAFSIERAIENLCTINQVMYTLPAFILNRASFH